MQQALGIDWLSAHGWSVFVSNNASANSKCLATSLAESAIMQSVFVRQPMPGQLFWTQNLAICRDTICPSVLTENFFRIIRKMSNSFYLLRESNKLYKYILMGFLII